MIGYIYLAIAIVAEIIGMSALKHAAGFTKLIPSIIVGVGYFVAFLSLSAALNVLPLSIGIIYAIWSGAGIISLTAIDFMTGVKLNMGTLFGISLIIAGIVFVRLFPASQ